MNTIFCEKRRAGARLLALLCAMILAGACLPALGEESAEAEETVTLASLPIDLTPGPAAPEENFTEDGYEDPTITVKMEKVTTEKAIYNVARVTIGDASQLRTYITAKGRTNKISALAEKAGAIVATGGDYYGSDKGGYIVRQGEVVEKRKSPYETRDLLCIDEKGDFHILRRIRDAKKNGKSKSINPDFKDQLKALTEEHTLVNVFEWGPALVIGGEVQEIPDSYSGNPDGREPRCAIGQTGPLSYVMVVVDTIKHHDRSGKEGATTEELAQFMADLGCQEAYNLDGGNSALMYFHGGNYSDKTVKEERSVSDIIYFATAMGEGSEP